MNTGAVDTVFIDGGSDVICRFFQFFHGISHGYADAGFPDDFQIIHTVAKGNSMRGLRPDRCLLFTFPIARLRAEHV